VLCGISTSGVVLSTTKEAADKDYKLTVLSDLCFDSDPEVHAILTKKLFPRQATVQTSGEWMGEM
jgi:nicotinamidase-related amidase